MSRAPQPRRRRGASQIKRIALATAVTIAMAFAALIHFRIGEEHLYSIAENDLGGPFSGVVGTLGFIIPIAIGGILVVTWYWVLVGPVQDERTVRRRP